MRVKMWLFAIVFVLFVQRVCLGSGVDIVGGELLARGEMKWEIRGNETIVRYHGVPLYNINDYVACNIAAPGVRVSTIYDSTIFPRALYYVYHGVARFVLPYSYNFTEEGFYVHHARLRRASEFHDGEIYVFDAIADRVFSIRANGGSVFMECTYASGTREWLGSSLLLLVFFLLWMDGKRRRFLVSLAQIAATSMVALVLWESKSMDIQDAFLERIYRRAVCLMEEPLCLYAFLYIAMVVDCELCHVALRMTRDVKTWNYVLEVVNICIRIVLLASLSEPWLNTYYANVLMVFFWLSMLYHLCPRVCIEWQIVDGDDDDFTNTVLRRDSRSDSDSDDGDDVSSRNSVCSHNRSVSDENTSSEYLRDGLESVSEKAESENRSITPDLD